jgi:hypothetical protein
MWEILMKAFRFIRCSFWAHVKVAKHFNVIPSAVYQET